jgi:hypothetical protein
MMRHWVDAATEAARTILQKRPDTVLYVGMQPYAAALVGLRLQRELGVRWVADLADPWTLDEVTAYSSVLHYWRQQGIVPRRAAQRRPRCSPTRRTRPKRSPRSSRACASA